MTSQAQTPRDLVAQWRKELAELVASLPVSYGTLTVPSQYGQVSDLSRRIDELSAVLDAQDDALTKLAQEMKRDGALSGQRPPMSPGVLRLGDPPPVDPGA